MTPKSRPGSWLLSLLLALPSASALAEEPAKPDTKTDSKTDTKTDTKPAPAPIPSIGLLDAMREGVVSVDAEGIGDGKMAISVTNNTRRKLRVVLPPGLVASGATGQFGGMGGFGGGGMGGGMGGMGGMGGGMGGGMMGGRGGMGGGGMMGGRGQMLTMPPTMGLMMVGRLIMTLVEPTESWNPRTLMMGMMGMGGMGMGGMGGGMMGGMGGMGGMMGGGMRSVPPTDLPDATLQPGQTRRLSTRVVSLNPPSPEAGVLLPEAGEKLLIGDVAQVSSDPRVQKALRRLAADKAPETISQVVLWKLAGKLEWEAIAQLTQGWVNPQEMALARRFVEGLDTLPEGESGRLFIEIVAMESPHEKLATDLTRALGARTILGLQVASGVPEKPNGPSIGCKVQFVGEAAKPEALVRVAENNGHREWTSMGKFSLPVPLDKEGRRDLAAFGDQLAEGVLARLVRARVIKGRKSLEGTPVYTLQVDNASSMILNGFALTGALAKPGEPPHLMLGISLPPQRSLQLPLTPGQVEAYGMKKGTHLVALDLSAL